MSRQGTLTLSPNLIGGGFSNFYIASSYTVSSIRALQRGFDGTTFDSPAQRYWTRGDLDARHQFTLQGGYARGPLTLSLFGRLQSGLPFTPIVGGDVNGELRRALPTILNPVQLRLLPAIVRLVYDANAPLHIRIFIAGG